MLSDCLLARIQHFPLAAELLTEDNIIWVFNIRGLRSNTHVNGIVTLLYKTWSSPAEFRF